MTQNLQCEEEWEWIVAILAGDAQHYHRLIRPYERAVYVICRSFMANDSDAEALAQEIFIKVFRSLISFQGDSKFGAWVLRTAIDEVRNKLWRQPSAIANCLDHAEGKAATVSPVLLHEWRPLPSCRIQFEEVEVLLRSPICILSKYHLRVFILRDVEGLSIEETAHILDMTLSQVRAISQRTRMILKHSLVPNCR
jgi:RNA polymerase sigma-70 factor (ECF subfamily)